MVNEFSVAMCVYDGDRAEHFEAALRSVKDQTLLPTEIVLTVDGPVSEKIEAVIRRVGEELEKSPVAFQVVRLDQNQGCGEAKRICFQHCSWPLVALMDADDLSVPDRFKRQIEYFSEHPEVSVVGGNITEFISAADPVDISRKAGNRIVPEEDGEIREYMKKRCPMNHVTVMFRKSDIAEVGGYIDWYGEEDYYLWVRLALAGKKFGNIPESLVNVRVGKEMYRRRGGWKYFRSEARLQRLMLNEKIISAPEYVVNVGQRFILQVLMPNSVRGWIFQKFARS